MTQQTLDVVVVGVGRRHVCTSMPAIHDAPMDVAKNVPSMAPAQDGGQRSAGQCVMTGPGFQRIQVR